MFHGLGVGWSCSLFSTGGSCFSFSTGSHVLPTLFPKPSDWGDVPFSVSALLVFFAVISTPAAIVTGVIAALFLFGLFLGTAVFLRK